MEKEIKLHLGCQEKYLKGYINIDLPPEDHTVQEVRADKFADVRELEYEPESISEIRSHHLLEHFSRQEALMLLAEWHKWLIPGGLLVVETPDFEESAKKFLSSNIEDKMIYARHIFGSEEARWAYHKDFWSEEKFKYILPKLGYGEIECKKFNTNIERKMPAISPFIPAKNKLARTFKKLGLNDLPNVVCYAKKTLNHINYLEAISDILKKSLVGRENENNIHKVWLKDIEGKI